MKTYLLLISLIAAFVPTTVYSANSCEAIIGTVRKASTDLSRKYTEGTNEDHLFREGPVASHTYISNNKDNAPYMFVAMPEGNTGFGLWFKTALQKVRLHSTSSPTAVWNGAMHGTEIEMAADATSLALEKSILSSMRFVRSKELNEFISKRVFKQQVTVKGRTLTIERKSFNRLVNYQIRIEVLGDTEILGQGDDIRFESKSKVSKVRLKVTVLTDEKPLTAVALEHLFEPGFLATLTQEEKDQISFLIYKEKLMAGSPRYQTKFGRDTLISLRVFMKYMKPEGLETLIIASLSSANPKTGQTSHEQHEGEINSLERIQKHQKMVGVNDPIEDYAMVDDDFMLGFLTADYMKTYPGRAKEFLEKRDARGLPVRDLVRKNYEFIIKSTQAFANDPVYSNLIRLKPGHLTGQWRDSEIGLGLGVYPFDVNAAIVPGTLRQLSELFADQGHEFFDSEMARQLKASTEVWSTKVLPMFMVTIPARSVSEAAQNYMNVLGFDMNRLPAPPAGDIVFPAISLREDGTKVKIMHTDDSMMGTYGHPPVGYLENMTKILSTPFPYGLRTDAGLVVANAVFESTDLQQRFTPKNYHGLVSWGREENLLIFGISRQMGRPDVPPELRQRLSILQHDIGKLVQKKGGVELVAIVQQQDGTFVSVPFDGDALPNVDQFWNHLFVVSRALLLRGAR